MPRHRHSNPPVSTGTINQGSVDHRTTGYTAIDTGRLAVRASRLLDFSPFIVESDLPIEAIKTHFMCFPYCGKCSIPSAIWDEKCARRICYPCPSRSTRLSGPLLATAATRPLLPGRSSFPRLQVRVAAQAGGWIEPRQPLNGPIRECPCRVRRPAHLRIAIPEVLGKISRNQTTVDKFACYSSSHVTCQS